MGLDSHHMEYIRLISITLLVLIAWSIPSSAESPPILDSRSRLSDTAARQHYASKLLIYFATANDAIPNLSPSQEQWLAAELTSGASDLTKRYVDAVNSNEFMLKDARQYMMTLVDVLSDIESGKAQSAKEEIYWWSVVAYTCFDSRFTSEIQALVTREVIDSPVFAFAVHPSPDITDVVSVYKMIAMGIMSEIIIPFLR
jgi:hypothetical protein